MDPLQGKITPLRRLWHQWKSLRNVPFRRKWFVGYDLEGNTFWEFKVERRGKMRRLVEYHDTKSTLAEYSQKKVHPRWSSWLRFTRPTPPSLHELLADEQRQQVMKILAQQADERWKNESVLEEDKRILQERILSARNVVQGERPSIPQKGESPIETAQVQPRR